MTDRIDQHLSVSFDFPVIFTENLFSPENPALLEAMDRLGEKRIHRAIVFLDSSLETARQGAGGASCGRCAEEITAYFAAHSHRLTLACPPQIVPGGETIKNDFSLIEQIVHSMLDLRLDRHSFVIAIGGGAVLDAVGFAAALVHRGLRLVRVPTTVLAQCDGGVGVKNAINFGEGKNALGTFAPPFAVINDFAFLSTLPDREWRSGVAEAFKVGIIRDSEFFSFLEENASKFCARDLPAMKRLIVRCAELHLEHIRTSGDPFELGQARPLDFGHWSAHKLEMMSGFKISHGDAVAVGIALDSHYARAKSWLDEIDVWRICAGLSGSGFPLWFDELARPELFDGLREFQEHLGGELCITFPKGIGDRHEVHEIDRATMEEAIRKLGDARCPERP